jgi:hypothetical protein
MVEHAIDDSGSAERLDSISISKLSSKFACPRCVVLQRFEPYTESIENLWASWTGSMFHTVLEQHPILGDICEVRVSAYLPGTDDIVTGMADTIRPWVDSRGGAGLFDMKTGKKPPMWDNPYDDHARQLQYYRWLYNNCYEASETDLQKVNLPADEAVDLFRNLDFKTLGVWYVSHASEQIKPLEIRRSIEVATKPGAKNATKGKKVPWVWSDETVLDLLVPSYYELKGNYERYMEDGTLPDYPAGVTSPMPQHYRAHQYSGVAHRCLELYYKEGR